MKTLVLNCGSSSLKFQLIDTEENKVYAKGLIEKIGTGNSYLNFKPLDKSNVRETLEIRNHDEALKWALGLLTDRTRGVIGKIDEIEAVGHRVVHGGEAFSGSVLITDEVLGAIKECSVFAPLHNPPNIMGIEACKELMKGVKQVAVFDTAFHQKIPPHAYLYGLPYAMYSKMKIRRYGFHGTSHMFVSKKAAELLGKDYATFKAVICHLGNGASVAAVKNGSSVDTSMGFTPLEGLLMGTRCGDVDPAIIPYVMESEKISAREMDGLMNKSSGLKGISQTSSDMREIEEMQEESDQHRLALEMFCYRVRKYIGSYLAVLDGADAIVFTAGIGENSALVRSKVCNGLSFFGVDIDEEKNKANDVIISKGSMPVMVVPTNEELAIAMETGNVVRDLLKKESMQEEAKKTQNELSRLTDSQKAKIAIFYSKNAKMELLEMVDTLKRRHNISLSTEALKELLKSMDILE